MRSSYVHEAVLLLEDTQDDAAPGAVITDKLCGSWAHEGPCPLAPHHTRATREGDRLQLRVLFAVEPDQESAVRAGILEALAGGQKWELISQHPGQVAPSDAQHAALLTEAD